MPQGTLIRAVLESALDSTGAGQVRAMVTRDVVGFDGTRVLIPRGTRLYGTYDAAIDQGQRRAQIKWVRLIRPDAVTMILDSPASDPLGRAGVEGRVDNHFGARLGNAFLSTVVNLGSVIGSQRLPTVIVAAPGQVGAGALASRNNEQIRPTLTVRQGTRVSVFVRQDLDFGNLDQPQP